MTACRRELYSLKKRGSRAFDARQLVLAAAHRERFVSLCFRQVNGGWKGDGVYIGTHHTRSLVAAANHYSLQQIEGCLEGSEVTSF